MLEKLNNQPILCYQTKPISVSQGFSGLVIFKLMEETLITFETAKLAKKKGFNIQCNAEYFTDGAISLTSSRETFIRAIEHNKVIACMAPTQSLLQKWLRERHNIDITVITDWNKPQKGYYVGLSYINDKNQIDIWFSRNEDGRVKYQMYETALEAALQFGLSLIN